MAAHRYWRLRIHSTHSADVWCGIATLTGWSALLDGDQLLSSLGVVCSASSTFGGFPAAQVNDNNVTTSWLTGTFADPTDVKFDLGVGVAKDIRQIQFTGRNDPAFYAQYPKAYDWQWSDDDITYNIAFSGVSALPTGPGQFYTSPSVAPASFERLTTADVLVAANGPTVQERVTQLSALAAYTSLAVNLRLSSAAELVTVKSATPLRVTNAEVLVAVKGRVANPKLRAWTFTLDGHDFYVLRLGTMGTLVYDLYSQQWMDWDAFSEIYWPVNVGINWVDGQGVTDSSGNVFGSNVLVGDDTYPLLYILEPEQPYDQAPDPLDPVQNVYFPRVIQGQYPITGRQAMPCYAVWLTTDMGAPAYVGAGVQLEISDDAGVSYQDMGTVTVTPGVTSPEVAWYSLGQITAPGRLFRITDNGAVARIDAMEMNDPDQK